MAKAGRTTHRSSKNKTLYAVRDASGRFTGDLLEEMQDCGRPRPASEDCPYLAGLFRPSEAYKHSATV